MYHMYDCPQPTEREPELPRQPYCRLRRNYALNVERQPVKDQDKRKAKRKLQRKARKASK